MSLQPQQLLESLRPWLKAPCWWLGLSGGLDSTVLLHLLSLLSSQRAIPPLRVIHVNHQLSEFSADWMQHCEDLCVQHDIEFVSRQVQVEQRGDGPEAAAREARYNIFEELVGAGELLLLAHHADDQVETFFLRLLRGAGTHGLSAMPQHRPLGGGQLLRPLLHVGRAELESYAFEQQLRWVEDDSNSDLALDRNYLRREVLPLLEQRWPAYRNSVMQSVEAVSEAEAALAEQEIPVLKEASGQHFGEPTLDLEYFRGCTAQRLCRLLRFWLRSLGLEPPGRAQLEEFVRQLQTAESEKAPELLCHSYHLCRYQDYVYVHAPLPPLDFFAEQELRPGEALELAPAAVLEARRESGAGLKLPAAGAWQVRYRQGGERCQPAGREHSQSLKKLLQDYQVPPWWRPRLPLIYAGEELVAVANLWVCEGYTAAADEESCVLDWQLNFTPLPD